MEHLLVLAPVDPTVAADHAGLIGALQRAGLIADTDRNGFYLPGDRYLELITFLGCNVVVSLGEPGATADVCKVEVPLALSRPQFFAGDNLKPPRCPGCGHRATDGSAIATAWVVDNNRRWTCPGCGRDYAAPQLDWRRSAGFARQVINLWGVFESEAVPGDQLLDMLAKVTGTRWNFFYLRRN